MGRAHGDHGSTDAGCWHRWGLPPGTFSEVCTLRKAECRGSLAFGYEISATLTSSIFEDANSVLAIF